MKPNNFIIIAFILIVTNSYAQDFGTQQLPLQIGNVWMYRNYFWQPYYQYSIVTDSVMINGYFYYKVGITNWPPNFSNHYYYIRKREDGFYVKFDSTYGLFPMMDYLYFKDSLSPGDSWSQYTPYWYTVYHTVLDTINLGTFWGTFTKTWWIEQTDSSLALSHYFWSEEFGIVERSIDSWEDGNRLYLSGCVINGVQYGDTTIWTDVEDNENQQERTFVLNQNFPNPFNSQTTISYYLPHRSHITLKLYDILGKELKILLREELESGEHNLKFIDNSLPSGVYFYELRGDSFREIKKMTMIK